MEKKKLIIQKNKIKHSSFPHFQVSKQRLQGAFFFLCFLSTSPLVA